MDINYYKKYEPFFGSWYIKKEIGCGSYGRVFEIIKKDSFGGDFSSALKIITIPPNEEEWGSLVLSEGFTEANVDTYYREMIKDYTKEFILMSELKGNSNIVSYEDHQVIEHEDGKGWDILIRMELLTPLYKYLENNAINEEDVVKLGKDICSALELCEKNNIIHRDIKPENIFISKSGDFKLGDFGVARIADRTVGASTHVGTTDYMAPEIVLGGQKYDNRVDIYSLGLVMYRLLNGKRFPFLPPAPKPIHLNDRRAAFSKRVSGDLPLPAPAFASEKVAKVILKACAYRSEDRYYSAKSMRTALEGEGTLGRKQNGYDNNKNISTLDGDEKTFEKKNHSHEDDITINKTNDDFIDEGTIAPDVFYWSKGEGQNGKSKEVDENKNHITKEKNSLRHDENPPRKGGRRRKLFIPIVIFEVLLITIVCLFIFKPDVVSIIQGKIDKKSNVSAQPSKSDNDRDFESSDKTTGKSSKGLYEFDGKKCTADEFYNIGVECFFNGDYDKAFEIMTQLDRDGFVLAYNSLGYLYEYGLGVKQDRVKAYNRYYEGAINGEPYAQMHLGLMYEAQGNYGIAVNWYKEAANQGLAPAQYYLGNMYYWGKGVNQDYQEAMNWYQQAANQGDEEAIRAIKELKNEKGE